MERMYFKSSNAYVIGNGESRQLAIHLKKLGIHRALLVSDPTVTSLGIVERVTGHAAAEGIVFTCFCDCAAEPPVENTNDAFALYQSEECDGVVGLGGGSAMDVAKAVAMLATNPGSYQDYVGVNRVPNRCAPLVLIPTTSGTGSEVSMFSIMMVDGVKAGVCDQNICAHIALVDPELTLSVPRSVTAATGLDTLCHLLEVYLSKLTNSMAEMFAIEGISYVFRYLRKAVLDGSDLEARYWMSYAATLGGFGPNLTDGCAANHGFAFALGAVYHLGHGVANSVVLPYTFPVVAKAELDKMRRLATAMGENVEGLSDAECADVAAGAITRLVSDVGMLTPLGTLCGGSEKDLDHLVEETLKQTRVMGHSTYVLRPEEIRAIFARAM